MVLARFGPDLQIGVIASAMASVAAAEPKAAAKGKLFRGEGQHFGDMLPFADPMWMQDWYSP